MSMIELRSDGISRPLANKPQLRVLSLGAGVQSTTIALMAARGEIESPDCAIFADTGDEPAAVYEHLAWLMSPGLLPFPVHIARCHRSLREPAQVARFHGAVYLHHSRVPLAQADLMQSAGPDLFGNECEGMCGV